jgi:hypothetical protein
MASPTVVVQMRRKGYHVAAVCVARRDDVNTFAIDTIVSATASTLKPTTMSWKASESNQTRI